MEKKGHYMRQTARYAFCLLAPFSELKVPAGLAAPSTKFRVPVGPPERASVLVLASVLGISVWSFFYGPGLAALEVSLEENKGERGSVGFVDMQRVFSEYPATQKAREEFDLEIQRWQDSISERRARISFLKSEIARLQLQKESGMRYALPGMAFPLTAAGHVAEQGATLVAPVPGALPEKPLPPAAESLPQPTTGPQEVHFATVTPTGLMDVSSVTVSVPPTTAGHVAEQGATLVAPQVAGSSPTAVSSSTTVTPQTPDLESLIRQNTEELKNKEKDLKSFQATAEKELTALESRKSQVLLGKIYQVLQQVAHDEGVSVVVDKGAILYGQPAVDLTEKLLKRLNQTL